MALLTALRRWTVFNAVGVAGAAVQLATLAALVRAGVHPVVATALSVETAVIHNFAWHRRWTWRDRPTGSIGGDVRRFVRFQMLNGFISLAGNVGLVAWLSITLHVPPLAANLTAIVVCSAINFVVSDGVIFRRRDTVLQLCSRAGDATRA
jgi:putative flippase GtrA